MKSRYKLLIIALVLLHNFVSFAQSPTQTTGSITWQEERSWHQHYDATPLDIALPLVKKPGADDPIPIRISGVWANRFNFNLWRHRPDAFIAPFSAVIHGYIDESNINNIPRFKFVGGNWLTDPQAKTAKQQVIKAFAEWSALQAGKSPTSGQQLKTGLEFRLVEPTQKLPNPQAEIELYWAPLVASLAANTHRTISGNGVVDVTQLTFNASNNWWFGTAATTPPVQQHFYSTALHEIGHIVGLWESNNPLSVMIHHRNSGPNGPTFDTLDEFSKQAVYRLYSIPSTEAPHPNFTRQ